jgi:hypothetical protein
MISRSAGRLRGAHIYQDTQQVLGEIADDQGPGEQVRNWFRRPGYVPESLFHLFAGHQSGSSSPPWRNASQRSGRNPKLRGRDASDQRKPSTRHSGLHENDMALRQSCQ